MRAVLWCFRVRRALHCSLICTTPPWVKTPCGPLRTSLVPIPCRRSPEYSVNFQVCTCVPKVDAYCVFRAPIGAFSLVFTIHGSSSLVRQRTKHRKGPITPLVNQAPEVPSSSPKVDWPLLRVLLSFPGSRIPKLSPDLALPSLRVLPVLCLLLGVLISTARFVCCR